ncbi:golgin subfamily B member 1-like isoform X2 [Artemia franciscana]
MEKAKEEYEVEKSRITARLNEAESKLAPLRYQHHSTLARNISLNQTNKEWRERALIAKGSTKKPANKKSAIPVRRTKSAPNSVHISDHMGTLHKHQDRNRKNAKAEVRVEDTTKAIVSKLKTPSRMERKFSQRLKCDLPPLIECEGETILDGNKSPDSEASEDSGFCGEIGRKDLEMMYAHLFREHQELQRSHAATSIVIGKLPTKERRRRSESPKWDYTDIQAHESLPYVPFPDGSDDPVNFHAKKLERLRLRNIALESELQDMHDQNELLEFRLLELEECQGNRRRDIMDGTKDLEVTGSGQWTLDAPFSIRIGHKEENNYSVINSKIEENKSNLRSLAARLTYPEEKSLIQRTVSILESYQELLQKVREQTDLLEECQDKQSKNVTRIRLPEMRSEKFQESGIFDDSGFEDSRTCDFSSQTEFEDFEMVVKEIETLRKFKKSVEHLRLAPVLPLLTDKCDKAVQFESESSSLKKLEENIHNINEEKRHLQTKWNEAKAEINNLLEKLGAAEVALVNTVNQLETEMTNEKSLMNYLEEIEYEVIGAFSDIGIEKGDDSDVWCIKQNLEALRECMKLYSNKNTSDTVSIYIKDTFNSDLNENNEMYLNKELEKFYLDQIDSLQKEKVGLRRSYEEEKQKMVQKVEELTENLKLAEKQIEEGLEKQHSLNEQIKQYECGKEKSTNETSNRIKFLESELRQLDEFYRKEMTLQKQAFLKDYEELGAKENDSQIKIKKLRGLLNDICQELEFDMKKRPETTSDFASISEFVFDDDSGDILIERVRNLIHEECALRQKNIDLERKERAYRETLQEADAIMSRVEDQHRKEMRCFEENERQLQEKILVLETSEKKFISLLQSKNNDNDLISKLNASYQLVTSLEEQISELEHVNAELNFKLIEEEETNSASYQKYISRISELERLLAKESNTRKSLETQGSGSETNNLKRTIDRLEAEKEELQKSINNNRRVMGEQQNKLLELEILKGELQEAKTLLEQKVHLLTDSPAKENKKDCEEASFRAEISKMRNQLSIAQGQMKELESVNCSLREQLKVSKSEAEKFKPRTLFKNAEAQTDLVHRVCKEIQAEVLNKMASKSSVKNRLSSEEILEDIALTEKFIDDIFDDVTDKHSSGELEVLRNDLIEKQTVLEVLDAEAKQLTMKIQEKDAVIKDLEKTLNNTSGENGKLKKELESVRIALGKSLQEATVVKQTLEKRRSVGRSSSFSGIRSPRDRPRSIRFEPKTIEERVLEKKSLTDEEVAPPSDFKVTRRVGDDGLVVAWIPPPDFDAICGYIICANGEEIQRVRSADRTKAVLYNLPTGSDVNLTIQSITKEGSFSKSADTFFNPDVFNEVDSNKRC